MQVTNAKNAKTLSPSHMKQCILSESRFDFLKDLVEKIPDVSTTDEVFDPVIVGDDLIPKTQSEHNYASRTSSTKISGNGTDHTKPVNLTINSTEVAHCSSGPNFYKELSSSSVIQCGPNLQNNKQTICNTGVINHTPPKLSKLDVSPAKVVTSPASDTQPVYHLDLSRADYNSPTTSKNISQGSSPMFHLDLTKYNSHTPPPLVPITDNKQIHPLYSARFPPVNLNEELDEDYDN